MGARPNRTQPITQNGKTYKYTETDTFIAHGQIWERDIWACVSDTRFDKRTPYSPDNRLMFSEPTGQFVATK